MKVKETVLEDRRIVELYLERSEEAILETDIKYGRYCHRIAFNILGNDEDSEECVNDAYMRTWGSIPPNEPKSLSSFIGKITRNLALDKLRNKKSDKRGGGEMPLALDELSDCVSGFDEISRREDSAEIREALNKFLEGLNPVERNVFMLRYWMLEPIDNIADMKGMSTSKVTTMLFRLRNKLKKHFMKEGIPL